MKDYSSLYSNNAKSYYEMLNRRKPMEEIGDAFKGQADAMKPMNVGQRREQAMMRGFGAGINMGARAADEAKIKQLEEDARAITMQTKEILMTAGKNQLKKEKYNLFLTENYAGLMQLSDLMQSGEDSKVDIAAPELFRRFNNIMGEDLGQFTHYKNGYFNFIDKRGKPQTINSQELLQPLMNMLPDEQKQQFKGFLTPLQMKDIDRMSKEKDLKLSEYQAKINNLNAHGELYKSQSEKVLNESKNPPMTDRQKILFKNNVENNQKWLNEEAGKLLNKKILVETLDTLEKVLIEADKTGDVGSNIIPIANRFFGKYITGNNKNATLADMVKAAYFGRVKEVGGSNPSTTEMLTTLDTIPNANKNLFASLQVLNKDRSNALRDIMRFNTIEKNLREREYQGSPHDPNVYTYKDEEFNKFVSENTNKEKIKLSLPKTSKREAINIEVPITDYEKYYNKGFRYYKGK